MKKLAEWNMRIRWALLVTSAALIITLVYEHQSARADCFEDMPCWDCTTMGNRLCGAPAGPLGPTGLFGVTR